MVIFVSENFENFKYKVKVFEGRVFLIKLLWETLKTLPYIDGMNEIYGLALYFIWESAQN